jgi:hypothetical protein
MWPWFSGGKNYPIKDKNLDEELPGKKSRYNA